MNKIVFFLLLIVATGLYIFNLDQPLTDKFSFLNGIKKAYVNQITSIEESTTKYFNQAQTIEHLTSENEKLTQYKTLYENTSNTLNNILENYSSIQAQQPEIKLAKVLSYVSFDDFTKVWLELPKTDKKIQGLISNNHAAGIVINQANQSLALLNGNEKSNYAVFIGDKKAPGIVHGSYNKNNLTVKFIPIWIDIEIGDEVITSGMDNIFFEGLKVGKVISIKKMPDMQEAIITPYAKVLKQNYFYVYAQKEQPKPLEEEQKKELLKQPQINK